MNYQSGLYNRNWNLHPNFKKKNNEMKNNIVLNLEYKVTNRSQFDYYSELLNKLLDINNGIINIDFINNFNYNIYYDVTSKENYTIDTTIPGEFGIKITPNKEYIWEYDNKQKYKIIKTINQYHGNTTIHILENKSEPKDKKVLKVFNSYDILDKNDMIKNYTSLQIIKNINKKKELLINKYDSKNYFEINDEILDTYNFNMQKNFIKTENGNILLAFANIEPINDYIINIIMQQIEKDIKIEQRFIKYNNLFVTSINNQTDTNNYNWRYCILMDYMDGTIADYLKSLDIFKINEHNKQKIILDILKQTESSLSLFKYPQYLFTHSDLKVQNLFYKKNLDESITIYLGDFDKSSISYHSIRFYCKPPNINMLYDNDYMKHINLDIKQTRLNNCYNSFYKILPYKNDIYKLYSIQHNFMPIYISFDILMLILSLFGSNFINGCGPNKYLIQELIDFISKYIYGEIQLIIYLFNIYNKNKPDRLILKILTSDIITKHNIIFINKLYNYDYLHINKLYLTNDYNLCLSIPFTIDPYNKSIGLILTNNYIKPYSFNNFDIKYIIDFFMTTTNENKIIIKNDYIYNNKSKLCTYFIIILIILYFFYVLRTWKSRALST